MKHVKLKPIQLRSHSLLDERWVQDVIADDPLLLGLGDVVLKDRERMQRGAGRLDLLLQDAEGHGRYEVEIQLEGGAFAHGQAYVALSSCRSLEKMWLTHDLQVEDVRQDARVHHFYLLIGGEESEL